MPSHALETTQTITFRKRDTPDSRLSGDLYYLSFIGTAQKTKRPINWRDQMSKTTPLGTPMISHEQVDAAIARARVERAKAYRELIAAPIARAFKSIWSTLTGNHSQSGKPTVTGRA